MREFKKYQEMRFRGNSSFSRSSKGNILAIRVAKDTVILSKTSQVVTLFTAASITAGPNPT